MLRADAENRRKDGDDFYKLDAENIVAIREELSDDFLSLAGEQLAAVRRLVEQLDDDQLDTQLQFERYERERRRQEVARRTAAINISDEEQSSDQAPNEARIGGSQLNKTLEEQPKDENLHTGNHQQEEPKPTEPEPEASRPVEPERPEQQEQQLPDEHLEPLDQSILDILEED